MFGIKPVLIPCCYTSTLYSITLVEWHVCCSSSMCLQVWAQVLLANPQIPTLRKIREAYYPWKKIIITGAKEEKNVKGHLFGVPHVLNPIRQPGDSTALGLVSSFLQQKQRWSENTTWRLCSPIQTCTLLKGYGWFDFYLSTGVVRLAERLVSRQVGWQLPGWCSWLAGPGAPAGAKPHNHCNYLWRGKKRLRLHLWQTCPD